jgi:hypothetical protein
MFRGKIKGMAEKCCLVFFGAASLSDEIKQAKQRN